jgi:hypothetical protein
MVNPARIVEVRYEPKILVGIELVIEQMHAVVAAKGPEIGICADFEDCEAEAPDQQ